jgi:hypothetical protein
MTSMRWARRVACTEEMRRVYKIAVRKSEGQRLLGGLGVDGRIILNWIR